MIKSSPQKVDPSLPPRCSWRMGRMAGPGTVCPSPSGNGGNLSIIWYGISIIWGFRNYTYVYIYICISYINIWQSIICKMGFPAPKNGRQPWSIMINLLVFDGRHEANLGKWGSNNNNHPFGNGDNTTIFMVMTGGWLIIVLTTLYGVSWKWGYPKCMVYNRKSY